jgi:hypothetical protein
MRTYDFGKRRVLVTHFEAEAGGYMLALGVVQGGSGI